MKRINQLLDEYMTFVNDEEKRILFDRGFKTEDYSFKHTISVAILSGIIGKWMGFEKEANGSDYCSC